MQKLLFIFILAAICTATSYSIRPAYSYNTYVKQKTSAIKKNDVNKEPIKAAPDTDFKFYSDDHLHKHHLQQIIYDQENTINFPK